MKKVLAIISLTVISAAAVAQKAGGDAPGAVLATSIVSSAAKIVTTDIVINPNPVKGENFSLQFQNLETGKYNVYIFDNNGKKYLVKSLNVENGTSTEVLNLPKEVTHGTYILQVLSKTARFSKKMIVE